MQGFNQPCPTREMRMLTEAKWIQCLPKGYKNKQRQEKAKPQSRVLWHMNLSSYHCITVASGWSNQNQNPTMLDFTKANTVLGSLQSKELVVFVICPAFGTVYCYAVIGAAQEGDWDRSLSFLFYFPCCSRDGLCCYTKHMFPAM